MFNKILDTGKYKFTISHIGGSELNDWDLESIKTDSPLVWGVTDYEYECYEGRGVFFAIGTEGEWYKWELGHCSCYGPLENGYSGRFTEQEIVNLAGEYPEILEQIQSYLSSANEKKDSVDETEKKDMERYHSWLQENGCTEENQMDFTIMQDSSKNEIYLYKKISTFKI